MSKYIRRKREDMETWKLADLREHYPHIKSNSKEKFLDKLDAYWEEQDWERGADLLAADLMADIEVDYEEVLPNESLVERIKSVVPDYFNKAIAKSTGCECWEDNQIWFQKAMREVTPELQDAIISLGREIGHKWYKRTSCPPCLKMRVGVIKEYFNKHFTI